jgi:peptidoglycan/LPS O-acetylase OafA/YrhL
MRALAVFPGLQLQCSVLALLLALGLGRAAENLTLHSVEEGHLPPWLVGVVLVLTGLIVCLVGKSVFKPTLACSGFLAGTALAFLVLHKVQIETTEPIGNLALIELIACLVTGEQSPARPTLPHCLHLTYEEEEFRS